MKKAILFLLIALMLNLFSQAQLRVALVGGGHIADIKETNSLPKWDSIGAGYATRTGIHIGFTGDLQLGQRSPFYFQPGFIYHNKGRKYSNSADTLYTSPDTSFATSVYEEMTEYINYVDVPLNLVFKKKLSKNVRFMVGGGPVLSFFFNGTIKRDQNIVGAQFISDENKNPGVGNGPGKYKTLDIGVNGLAGFEFKKVFLTVNFSRSLTDMYQANYAGTFRNQVIGGTLGIFLGQPVDLIDKPKDTDQDGVIDLEDLCPTEPGTALTQGCPDTDADGIADKNDQCPQVNGLARYQGCPIPDSDKDGVDDEADQCKDVPGTKEFNGCPVPDSDGDGVNDKEDRCKDQAGVARYQGCPIPDSDKDGLHDEEDKCPELAGLKENNGCPPVEEAIVEKVNFVARQIQFYTGKSSLTHPSKQLLDEVAQIMKENPELQISIEGHTSSEGDPRYNQRLSETRARAVQKYLESKGVDASRLTSAGYGSTQLLNEEKTAAERSLNRRVELKLKNN